MNVTNHLPILLGYTTRLPLVVKRLFNLSHLEKPLRGIISYKTHINLSLHDISLKDLFPILILTTCKLTYSLIIYGKRIQPFLFGKT